MELKKLIIDFSIMQLLSVANSFAQETSNLTVDITGIKEIQGKIYVSVHSQGDGFPFELEWAITSKEIIVVSKQIKIQFKDLAHGVRAVSVYHDVNSNSKMDKDFKGIPIEPVGFSNNAKGNFGLPKFEYAKFYLDKDKTIDITIE